MLVAFLGLAFLWVLGLSCGCFSGKRVPGVWFRQVWSDEPQASSARFVIRLHCCSFVRGINTLFVHDNILSKAGGVDSAVLRTIVQLSSLSVRCVLPFCRLVRSLQLSRITKQFFCFFFLQFLS